jgi:hypothetical protein
MFVGQGGQRRNYSLELVGAGLATLDERKLEYGEVPKMLMDAMAAAQKNRVGIWSIEQKTDDVSHFLFSLCMVVFIRFDLTRMIYYRKRRSRLQRNPRRKL